MAVVISLSTGLYPGLAQSATCSLPSLHAGVAFPLELVEADWACKLEPIISHYTTANKLGPLRTPLSESVYLHLLDRPPMTASLINRLGIAPYQSEPRGSVRYWGNDGEGTEGIVELVYQDRTSRIYYLEGSHHSRLLPHIAGKAVVLLRMNQVTDSNGTEAMESTFVYYTRLDNRLLSGLLSLFRPLAGSTVTKKMVKGVESVNRLSLTMQQQPDRILSEAAKSPAFTFDEMALLKQMVEPRSHPIDRAPAKAVAP
ncbi:MAG: hypothetical protein NTX84_11835 [Nitrospirae bacterium]|nr:hypothetical protein [Nitrospirota bacterium]